jgi:hypothetical protein
MLVDSLSDLLWNFTVIFGVLSFIAIAGASYARRRFRACLHAPLTRSSGDLSEMWQEMAIFWHRSGLAMAAVSILCTILWRIV